MVQTIPRDEFHTSQHRTEQIGVLKTAHRGGLQTWPIVSILLVVDRLFARLYSHVVSHSRPFEAVSLVLGSLTST